MQPVEILAPNDQSVPGVDQSGKAKPLNLQEPPPLKNSLHIKAAEYWLKLGEADQALRELEMWLGAQDPDCCNGGVEGTRRNDGPSLNEKEI